MGLPADLPSFAHVLRFRAAETPHALLKRTVAAHHLTIIMVTHDSRAASYGDRVIVLKDGQILSNAPRASQ